MFIGFMIFTIPVKAWQNGNFITSDRLPGELDDGISGFGDVCYDNEYYYYASI